MTIKWIDWVKQIQSIAQAGLTYSKDVYDIERFQQLRDISISMMSHYTKTDWEVVEKLFASETGYQTPKVDIRAVVFQNEKLLFVKEKAMGNGHCQVDGLMSVIRQPKLQQKKFSKRLVMR